MSRPLRMEYAGALYHVTARGNERKAIYRGESDFKLYLELLGDVCDRYNWVIHAYCLMTNHYHLVVETPDANLSSGMRQLNGVYTLTFNRKHKRVGHLFQGRYKAIFVDKESYLLELSRYVVLNPVRANMVTSARDWQWSSYNQTTGRVEGHDWLAVDALLGCFSGNRITAIKRFEAFVEAGLNRNIWDSLSKGIFLGDESFVEKHQAWLTEASEDLSEVPLKQRRAPPPAIEECIATSSTRGEAMYKAYLSGGYSMKEIANYFGVHYSTVSRAVAKCKT